MIVYAESVPGEKAVRIRPCAKDWRRGTAVRESRETGRGGEAIHGGRYRGGLLPAVAEKGRAWFRERYGEDPWCNMIPPTRKSRNINQAGRERRLRFSADQVREAEAYWGVTHSVMAISAALIALSRFTEEQRVMVNWIFNNRLSPESEDAVGMLIRNLPAAADMDEFHSLRQLLGSVRDQVAEGIAHNSYDFMTDNYHVYKNDCLEVNLQLGINADELDALHPRMIPLEDAFSAAGARLELELLENEYGDGGFDSEMEYAEGLFDAERMAAFHDLYADLLEGMIARQDVWNGKETVEGA